MDKVVSDGHLTQIATGISDWPFLIPFLGLTPSVTIEINQSAPLTQAAVALRHWKAEYGAQATYTNLAEVFKRCSNLDLAKRVTELAREQTVLDNSRPGMSFGYTYSVYLYCLRACTHTHAHTNTHIHVHTQTHTHMHNNTDCTHFS